MTKTKATAAPSASTVLFTRAFLLWGAVSLLGFLPDAFFSLYRWSTGGVVVLFEPLADAPASAWALTTHFAGFAVFLFMVTNKKRWLVIPVVSTLVFMWTWRWTHLPREYWAIATHAIGYLLMGTALLMVMGVLSGIVYLWVELVSFVRQLWIFYPQVKRELRSHPLLEAVIVNAASSAAASSPPTPISSSGSSSSSSSSASTADSPSSLVPSSASSPLSSSLSSSMHAGDLHKIITLHKDDDSSHCFLCRREAAAYVEVCSEWIHPSGSSSSTSSALKVCTPFATLRQEYNKTRDQLDLVVKSHAQLRLQLEHRSVSSRQTSSNKDDLIHRLEAQLAEQERVNARLREQLAGR